MSKTFDLRYFLRKSGVPVACGVAHSLGLSWEEVGKKMGSEVMAAQARGLSVRPPASAAAKPLDVLFLTMIGGHSYLVAMELVLGLALRARGHRVRYVLADPEAEIYQSSYSDDLVQRQRSRYRNFHLGKSVFEAAGFEVVAVSDLVPPETPLPEAGDDFEFAEEVHANLLKHYKVGVIEENDDIREKRRLYERTATLTAKLGEVMVNMKPDRVIMSHGVYAMWAPPRKRLLDAGVPVLTYGKGKKKLTVKFNWSTSADWWDVSAEWERVKDKPLNDKQNAVLDDYLQSRRDHSRDTLRYNFGEEETLEQTYERLKLDPEKSTYALFTNVLWDASSAQREIAFNDAVDWTMQTLAWFQRHPDKQLVVKIHPSEVVIGTNQPFYSLIADRFPEGLPPNVRIIKPEEKVNSWSIMRVANLGLVHTSTIGLEMVLEGIPCAVVSKTHYRERGFTIDVDSRDAYFELLENFDASNYSAEQLMEQARRYFYLVFERYQLDWPYFVERKHADVVCLDCEAIEGMFEAKEVNLVVENIENMGEFILPDPLAE